MNDYTRQLEIAHPDTLKFHITLVGAGGIGSAVALELTKMGCSNMLVIDDDVLEAHNIPNQLLYPPDGVGQPKVVVLKREIEHFTGFSIDVVQGRFPAVPLPPGVVVSGVDTMAARSQIWKAVRYNAAHPLYIDGRMNGEEMRVYTLCPVDPDLVERYEKTLYTDAEAMQGPCTNRSVIYTPSVISGIIASRIAAFARKEGSPLEFLFNMATLGSLVNA